MNESIPGDPAGPRRISPWIWGAGALLFPAGTFLAMGVARLLSWPRSAVFAAASFLSGVVFVRILADLDASNASLLSDTFFLAGGCVMYSAWGYMIYGIGLRAGYWSPTGLRIWRRIGWLAVFFLSLSAVDIVLAIFAGNAPVS